MYKIYKGVVVEHKSRSTFDYVVEVNKCYDDMHFFVVVKMSKFRVCFFFSFLFPGCSYPRPIYRRHHLRRSFVRDHSLFSRTLRLPTCNRCIITVAGSFIVVTVLVATTSRCCSFDNDIDTDDHAIAALKPGAVVSRYVFHVVQQYEAHRVLDQQWRQRQWRQ